MDRQQNTLSNTVQRALSIASAPLPEESTVAFWEERSKALEVLVGAVVEACRGCGVEVDGARAYHGVCMYILLPGLKGYNQTAGEPFPRPELSGKRRVCVLLASPQATRNVLEAAAANTNVLETLRSNSGGWQDDAEWLEYAKQRLAKRL